MEPNRSIRHELLASMIALASLSSALLSQAAGDPAALCAKLRGGEWTIEDVQALVAGLVEQKATTACAWWLDAADDAVAANKLPSNARSAISALRTRVSAKTRAEPEVQAVWTRTSQHVRGLLSKNAPREAAIVMPNLEALAAAWNDQAWTRDCAELSRRIKAAKDSTGEAKLSDADRKLTRKCADQVKEAIDGRGSEALAQFTRYGCARGFGMVQDLVRSRTGRAPLSREIQALHRTAREFGLGKDLVVHVLGNTRIKIYQDQDVVRPEKCAEDGSVDASEFREIRLKVLPGEIVGLEQVLPKDAPTQLVNRTKEVPYAEIYARASLGGKDLPHVHWQAASVDQFFAANPKLGGSLYASIGENHSISIDGKYPICMNYAPANAKERPDNTIYLDAHSTAEEMADQLMKGILDDLLSPALIRYDEKHKALEAKVATPRDGFKWMLTISDKPGWLLLIPNDSPSKK